MKWTLFLFCFVGFIRNGLPKQQDGCPKFRLRRDSIINTSQSLANGAKFVSKLTVKSSKECYRECCERSTCSMGLMHYEKSKSSLHITKKTCFLFNCNYPSKCVYSDHPDYAAIELIQPEETSQELSPSEKPTKKMAGCPPGVPVAMCFANPCEDAECDAFPSATCKPYYCGGCFAHFYDSNNKLVKCEVDISSDSQKSVHKSETSKITDAKKDIVHEKKPIPTKRPTEEVHELRQWVDNNPNFPTPIWADWGIEDPSSQQRTKKPLKSNTKQKTQELSSTPLGKTSTAPAAPSTHDNSIDKKLEEIHEKVWKPPTKSPAIEVLECPKYKCAVNCEVFFVDASGCRTCQCVIGKIKKPNQHKMNVTLLVESKDVHVVENSAVIPLIIGLIVSIIMLIVVVIRLKSIKGKLRRRPFATDDADYLINGMYL